MLTIHRDFFIFILWFLYVLFKFISWGVGYDNKKRDLIFVIPAKAGIQEGTDRVWTLTSTAP